MTYRVPDVGRCRPFRARNLLHSNVGRCPTLPREPSLTGWQRILFHTGRLSVALSGWGEGMVSRCDIGIVLIASRRDASLGRKECKKISASRRDASCNGVKGASLRDAGMGGAVFLPSEPSPRDGRSMGCRLVIKPSVVGRRSSLEGRRTRDEMALPFQGWEWDSTARRLDDSNGCRLDDITTLVVGSWGRPIPSSRRVVESSSPTIKSSLEGRGTRDGGRDGVGCGVEGCRGLSRTIGGYRGDCRGLSRTIESSINLDGLRQSSTVASIVFGGLRWSSAVFDAMTEKRGCSW